MENNEVALKVIDKIDGRLQEMIDKVSSLTTEYGPDVVSLGFDVIRINGAYGIVLGMVFLIVSIVSYHVAVAMNKSRKTADSWSAAEFGCEVGLGVSMILSIALGVLTPFYLLDMWSWVAIFYPEAYLAHRVLGL